MHVHHTMTDRQTHRKDGDRSLSNRVAFQNFPVSTVFKETFNNKISEKLIQATRLATVRSGAARRGVKPIRSGGVSCYSIHEAVDLCKHAVN